MRPPHSAYTGRPRIDGCADACAQRGVRLQLARVELGETPADEQRVDAGQAGVGQGVEGDQGCARRTQCVEVVGVVEAERPIPRNADPDVRRRGRTRCRGRLVLDGKRRSARGDSQHVVEVDLPRDRRADVGDPPAGVVGLVAGHEPQVALDDRKPRIELDGADHRHVRVVLEHRTQLGLVAAAADVVEDHAADPDVALEGLVAQHQRRDAAGHAAGVDDQDHRQAEHAGERRVAVAAVEGDPVVEALVALDQRQSGAGRMTLKRGAQLRLVAEVRIEIATRAARSHRQPHRIDEVRALLEGLHREPARRERRGEPDGDRRLARRLVRRRDQDPRKRRRHQWADTPGSAGASSLGLNGNVRTPATVIRKARPSPPKPSTISGRLGM